jgi:cob(I)alamin adenosyltransferase
MAIRITRVYTRGGDTGKTSLVGGGRVDKDCLKLESYGTVDELICLVGTARTVIADERLTPSASSASSLSKTPGLPTAVRAELESALRRIQNRLFDMGSILATPAGQPYPGMPEITDADSTALEKDMDAMQQALEPLNSFVLPGGTHANAALHQCRAVCRRAERGIIRLSREEPVDNRLIKYINRLSDLFFVMSRYASRKAGVKEYLWEYGLAASSRAAEAKQERKSKPDPELKSNGKSQGKAGKPVRTSGKPKAAAPAAKGKVKAKR